MKKIKIFFLLGITLFVNTLYFCKTEPKTGNNVQGNQNYKLGDLKPLTLNKASFFEIISAIKFREKYYVANTEIAWLALLQTKPEGLITNSKEWENFKNSDSFYKNPLSQVPKDSLLKFEESISYGEFGLASVYYGSILPYLKGDQFLDVLCLFGIGRFYEDHTNYYCAGKGTCERRNNFICTGNCFRTMQPMQMPLFDEPSIELLRTTLGASK